MDLELSGNAKLLCHTRTFAQVGVEMEEASAMGIRVVREKGHRRVSACGVSNSTRLGKLVFDAVCCFVSRE